MVRLGDCHLSSNGGERRVAQYARPPARGQGGGTPPLRRASRWRLASSAWAGHRRPRLPRHAYIQPMIEIETVVRAIEQAREQLGVSIVDS
jgi:hypothetical protein